MPGHAAPGRSACSALPSTTGRKHIRPLVETLRHPGAKRRALRDLAHAHQRRAPDAGQLVNDVQPPRQVHAEHTELVVTDPAGQPFLGWDTGTERSEHRRGRARLRHRERLLQGSRRDRRVQNAFRGVRCHSGPETASKPPPAEALWCRAGTPGPRQVLPSERAVESGTMQAADPEVQLYLDRVVATLRDNLGAELVGAYLHGSLAMGAFNPGRSDVDIIGVCTAPLSRERRMGLGKALTAIPRPRSGGDLELSLVTAAAARTPSAAPSFQVHVRTHEEPSMVDGADRPGDEDLVVHFAIVRARGQVLIGPEPGEVFATPDRASLIGAFLSDIEWARESGAAGWEGHHMPEFASMAYRVLNAARCRRYLETGDLGSKVEGAAWLKRRDPDPDLHVLLDTALAFQRGDPPDRPDERTVNAFVDRVETLLRSAID